MRWLLGVVVALTGCGSTTCAGSTPTNNQALDGATDVVDASVAIDSAVIDTDVPESIVLDADVPPSRCGFTVLSVASEKPRAWASCGKGCAETVAARAGFLGAYAGSAVGTVDGDVAYVRLESGRPGRTAVELIRVEDGTVRVAVEADAACSLGARGSAFLFPFVDDGTKLKLFLAYANAAIPTPTWHVAAVEFPSYNTADFQWKRGFGSAWFGGRVAFLDAPSAPMFTTIDPGGMGDVAAAAAYDTQIVYSRTKLERAHIRSFVSGDTTSSLLIESSAYGVASLAVSASAIVWTGVHGPESLGGRYTAAEVYWSPRVTKTTDVKVTTGPSLPVKYLFNRLVSAGDYAAAVGCSDMPPNGCELLVVRMSDSWLWRYKARSGHVWADVLVASNQYIVVGEALPSSATGVVTDILRLETAKLDEVAW